MAQLKFLRGSSSNLGNVTKVDGQVLVAQDSEGASLYYDYADGNTVERGRIGATNEDIVKATGTVSGSTLAITSADMTANAIVDGPYVDGLVMPYTAVTLLGTTVTYTFSNTSANGKSAYVLIWK